MRIFRRVPLRRGVVGLIVAIAMLASSGCASPGQMVKGLVAVPFDVAEHVVVETAKLPVKAAGMGAKGVANAVFK